MDQHTFWPVEIKWTNQLRPEALKQILKYKNGQIWARVEGMHQLENTPIIPLPWGLLAL